MFRVAVFYLLSVLIVRSSYGFAPAQQARVLKGASPSGSNFPFKSSSAASSSLFMSASPEDRVAELKAAAAKAREDAERLSAELKQSKEEPASEKKPAATTTTTAVSPAQPQQQKTVQVSADGTFYDDEMDSAPQKDGLSDSMKARLMKEASTGLDSESKQTNTILYISAAVAFLVLIGGSGILY